MLNKSGLYLFKSLSGFSMRKLRFNLKTMEAIHLGPDEKKGDIWRGGFGEALRRLACFYRWEPTDCISCDKTMNCFYYVYFESCIPHPYVIRPSIDLKRVYAKGDVIHLDIILIGNAIEHVDKFIKTMEELGRIGIGANRGRFRIKEVDIGEPINLNDFLCTDIQPIEELVIEFLTPLKLKEGEKGIIYDKVPFETFFKLLIKRVINLNNLYCNGGNYDKKEIEREKQALLRKAKKIEDKSFTTWKDYKRFSSRQNKSMKIGGQIGMMELKGEIKPFYPFLRLGEIIGVGLNTTSGFGRYRLLPPEKYKVNV